MIEMEQQARVHDEVRYNEFSLLRLNQYNIHKVADVEYPMMRSFVKISVSKDRYNLEGNTHNYLLKYNWQMQQRRMERNIPQTKITH